MKIKHIIFLSLIPFSASAETCIDKSNGSLVEVLECFQRGLDKLDSYEKRIAKLEKENKALRHAISVSSEGNVGIGTTSPERQLHIKGPGQIKLENPSSGWWAGLEWSINSGTYTAYSGLIGGDGRYTPNVQVFGL